MLDIVARQQHQRLIRRQPIAKQALGDRPHTVEHLPVADAAPATVGLALGNKRLFGTHLGPMHQAIEQTRRQFGQWFQGAHVQHALCLSDLHRRMTDGHLAVSRCLLFGLGLCSEFGTHGDLLHPATPMTHLAQPGSLRLPSCCDVCQLAQIG